MPTAEAILEALRAGTISVDEAERRLAMAEPSETAAGAGAPHRAPVATTADGAGALPERIGERPVERMLDPAASGDDLRAAVGSSAAQSPTPPALHCPVGSQAARRGDDRKKDRVAVIGMSGRYAGADDLTRFWDNLAEGRCSIREIPPSRWDVHPYFQPLPIEKGKIYCKWMGMMDDVESFDPLFFNISPTEAELMDPQQRIFLQEAFRALEDAGYAGRSMGAKRCGVYLGIMGNEYLTMLRLRRVDAADTTGNSFAIAAARLSYFLNLKGPAIAIDTACSSSLVATHLACKALLGGEVDMAVVGGVTLYLSPHSYLGMCAAGMLSPDGRCRAFDDGANGFVPGEGAGALVLKRLEDAEMDGDAICGVISGSAINQDGQTNGITAPSMQSQLAVAREVYEKSGIDPGDIDYVEMHGTGTKLGDPVELEALSLAFKEQTRRRQYCAIGSVKSNIGHTSAAAGVASVQKVLLSLAHGQLPPTLNVERTNQHFDFADSPFYVNSALKAWESSPKGPRRAAVSSFGFSGTNAHMVVEEYCAPRAGKPQPRAVSPEEPLLFVLSAKTEERLGLVASQLLAWLEAAGSVDLADLAFTLQVGRKALEHRLAFVASSREGVIEALRAAARGGTHVGLHTGHLKKGKEEVWLLEDDEDVEVLVNAWLAKKKLSRLAEAWLRGLEVNWARLYGEPRPRRLHLPGYPFARERCWIPETTPSTEGLEAPLHPLLHQNVSDLFEQHYTSVFTGREPFLEDHLVEGSRVMPGAALLEMGRAAVARASRAVDAVCLERVTWTKPLVVNGASVRVDVRVWPESEQLIGFEITSRPTEEGLDRQQSTGPHYRGKNGGTSVRLEEREEAGPSVLSSVVSAACTGSVPDPAEDAAPIVHSRGRVALVPLEPVPTLALEAIRARCTHRSISKAECYRGFESVGIHYGPAHRGVEEISVGDGEALAALSTPSRAADDAARFVLDPSVVDSALQASAGLLAEGERGGSLALPVAVERIEIFGRAASAKWAHVRRRGARDGQEHRFDVDLCDDEGRVSCRIGGFTVRALGPVGIPSRPVAEAQTDVPGEIDGLLTLVPVWDAVQSEPGQGGLPSTGEVIVVGPHDGLAQAAETFPEARAVEIPPEASVDELVARLEALGSIGHIIWLAPAGRGDLLAGERLLEDQAGGVLCLFRLVKAALRAGYAETPLEWTIVTVQSQRVFAAEVVDPTHAGVHGLFGSLAKEYPRWRVRLLDLDADDEPSVELLSLPPDALGRSWVRRGGEWLRQKLIPARPASGGHRGFRPNGVYVVVGGAGGLGEVWTEYMLRTYQANVVWIGRRPVDSTIREKIDRLGALGPSPIYLEADARDPSALGEAYQTIKQRFVRVHGVVLSAIDLKDMSLAKMDEATFEAGLTAKVDVAVRVAQQFCNDTLDFVLFFSSVQSFQNGAGQANYAAGCAFSDALAHRLAHDWPCAVKVMNWGYWGTHGVVASGTYEERMAHAGIGSISPSEGMAALEALMSGPLDRVALLKTTRAVRLPEIDGLEVLERSSAESPRAMASLPPVFEIGDGHETAALATRHRAEMDEVLATLAGAQLATFGVDEASLRSGAAGDRLGRQSYRRWLSETAALLGLGGPSERRLPRGAQIDSAWREWEVRKARWSTDPDRRAQVRLLDVMLQSLPDILAGRRQATDVMFPGSSFELVEGLYHGSSLPDFFNQLVAEAVAAAVAKKVEQNPSAPIRILEIGGGTGGTTDAILNALEPWAPELVEYCFTDVSPSFLTRAQERWGSRCPYLTTRRFDVEMPPEVQGLETGAYDVAVAANVLHATRRIRNTLRNVKATLKRYGLLAAIEISAKTLFTHLTVGLLEGWWLPEDPALRIAGCPGLSPERWEAVLAQEGFGPVAFPAKAAHEAGQQVILAESDGFIRRRIPPDLDAERAAASCPDARPLADAVTKPEALDAVVTETIVRALCEALKVSAESLDADDAFSNYGVDSISGVWLVQTLNERLGLSLAPTDLFDHGSVNRLTAYVISHFGATVRARVSNPTEGAQRGDAQTPRAAPAHSPPAASGGTSGPQVVPFSSLPLRRLLSRGASAARTAGGGKERDRAPIAVIGMSGRFAHSADLEALWKHLARGDDLVDDVARWDLSRLHPPGARFCRRGSFVDDIDCFDPLFFKIAANEADYMDPQQRLFLEEAWKALEDAGYAGASVGGRDCGVYVGCSGSDYQMLFRGEVPAQAFWGNADSIVPARIAYRLDLQGPAIAVDTACSSSLVAVHLACQGLWSGEMEMALAGGIYLNTTPWFFQSAQRAGMLSHEGRCHVFDERADGFVPGEGVGAVVLKRLDAALADGDFVHGVIRGSAINQDGATNGITAPSARSQERLERRVYETFAIDPGEIQLVEAHGTGTKLGDPIEVDALTRAFTAFTTKRGFCALGSIKSNIGHATAAAGIAGLLKILLALRHRELPPSIHFDRPNPNIRLEGSPFYVNTSLKPWETEAGQVRRAAVSSFGFSGTNAHLVLEEAPAAPARPASRPGALVALSARTDEQLRRQAELLAARCEGDETLALADVSWTLLTGRKLLDHRLACVAADGKELAAQLRRWLANDGSTRAHSGEVSQRPEDRARWTQQASQHLERCEEARRPTEYREELAALGECFVHGGTVDPARLFDGERRGRVPLPTYPFARERYWVPSASSSTAREPAEAQGRLHPLVGRNTSTLQEQRFVTRLTWDDFFVGQHRVDGRAILPGVAFLELARAAGALAAERPVAKLENVAWLRPVIIPEEGKDVSITLEPEASGCAASFEVASSQPGGGREVHARGALLFEGEGTTESRLEKLDVAAIEARCPTRLSADECYAALEARGLRLGPALQAVTAVSVGRAEVLVSLELPQSLASGRGDFLLHPSMMDGALQAAIALDLGEERALYLPFTLAELDVQSPVDAVGFAHLVVTGEGQARSADVRIADEAGNALVVMKGFVARPARASVPVTEVPEVPEVPEASEVSGAGPDETICFERVWEYTEADAGDVASPETRPGATIILDRQRRLFERLSNGSPQNGAPAPVLLATPGDRFEVLDDGVFSTRLDVEADFDRLLEELGETSASKGGTPERDEGAGSSGLEGRMSPLRDRSVRPGLEAIKLVHVVSSSREPRALNGGRRGALLGQTEEVVLGLLHAIRAVRRRFPDAALEIISLASAEDGDAPPRWAAISGFLRAVATELSRVSWKTVELPEGDDASALRLAQEEIRGGASAAQELSYRDGRRRRAAWRERTRTEESSGRGSVRDGGVYVITGGLGGLGRAVALQLATRARVRLALCGRSPMSDEGAVRVREIERLGAEVLYLQADVSRAEDLERLVREVKARFGDIHGVIHAAGTTRDSLVMKKSTEEVEAVLAPKVLGTVFLDEVTRAEPLEFFVSFSSAAAAFGNAGQSDYAYANAFMDAFARRRASQVRRGVRAGRSISIDWPLWEIGGLRVDEGRLALMRVATGMKPLAAAEGLDVLEEILASSEGQVLVLSGDRRRLEELAQREAPVRGPSAGAPASGGAARTVEREIARCAAKVVGLEEGIVRVEKSLVDYGFDSISFATLAELLAARLGVALSPAIFFEFPTIRSLAAHLLEEWGDKLAEHAPAATEPSRSLGRSSPPPLPSLPVPRRTPRARFATSRSHASGEAGEAGEAGERRVPDPVAIVGLAADMPRSPSLEAFWQHLEAGADLVTELPKDRWEAAGFAAALAEAGEPGATLRGGFLDDVDKFDAAFFEISRREAELMDPQQRIFIELVWRAVEDAGYRMSELGGTRTGVFVGASTADYGDIVRAAGVSIEGHMATGLAPSVLANRVSYLFDWRGPSEPVDTACSSALVALHRAVEAIESGRCDQAVAGGVNVLLTPNVFISFIKAGMLSPDGRCKTFDKLANGYVRGEGGGAVLLKPLGRALEDGDHVYAVIKGTAVNHGGRASSLTAPNVAAQAEVLIDAYERAGVDPATVNYVEAHGTGTALGDPIEVDGLKRAFGELFKRREQTPTVGSCGLGSVKSNVGHLEAAAGIAGLVKVLMALKHRILPPAVHFSELNPFIHLDGSPFYVVDRPTPWAPALDASGRSCPRRAGLSSFGFGGANAHVVLEEHLAASEPATEKGSRPELIVLSAKSEERLRAWAASLRRYVQRSETEAGAVDLAALASTLQIGREPFEHRLAVVAASAEELCQRLEAFEEGSELGAGVFFGKVESEDVNGAGEGPRAATGALASDDLDAAARLWVRGVEADWRAASRGRTIRRLALPTYPFARERYWLEPGERPAIPAGAPTAASSEDVVDDGLSWRIRLAAPGADQRQILEAFLSTHIARTLKLPERERLDPNRPLVALGFDSLMALQLKRTVTAQLDLDLSLVKLLGGESTADLAQRISDLLSGNGGPALEMSLPEFDHPNEDMVEGVL